jgi:hypothetical protein
MKLNESLSYLRNVLTDIETFQRPSLKEDKGHLDHPEDLVFLGGSQGAARAVQSSMDTVQNPGKVTIKWDGYPALIFGRDDQGRFSIMDKHMFNKKDGSGRQVYSPEQFVQYDQARGVNRTELHQLIANIWPGLEKSDRNKGYYWGDLLFSQPLRPGSDKLYRFRANPNGITYTVDPNSEVGKELTGKTAGIVVHQFIDANAASTDDAVPLDGTIGKLKNNSNVAIVPAKMPITPKLKLNNGLVRKANAAIKQYGPAVDQMLDSAPQARNTFNQLFTTYINKKIVQGDLNNLLPDFMEYLQTKPMTDSMRSKIMTHLEQNPNGLKGAFEIWAAIYALKMSIVTQLNKAAESSPVKGYLQNGTQTQEGFVSHGLKFVDRMGFSRQNLAGRT